MARKKEQRSQRSPVHHFLYFDLAKAASILSQIEGGLLSELESSKEAFKDERNIRKYDLKVFRPEFGGVETESHRIVEKRIAYHEIFVRLENVLANADLITDVNVFASSCNVAEGAVHRVMAQRSTVKATGWATIDDYQRIQFIAQHFNSIGSFIGRLTLRSDPGVLELSAQIDAFRQEAECAHGKPERSMKKRQAAEMEKLLDERMAAATAELQQPDWLMEGLAGLVGNLMADRVILSVYPVDEYLPFRINANLKRDCFVDADVENVVYTYGARPNLKLTVFGLVTSLPAPHDGRPDPGAEYEQAGPGLSEASSFEQSFRPLFSALEDLQEMLRASCYPRVTVYPIAVYRDLG